MRMGGVRLYFILVCFLATSASAISLYEYFNPTGIISEGLMEFKDELTLDNGFTLNKIQIPIVSGSFHYFRVHPDYWRITLRKMKSFGLNTVTSYMPWNLHNPKQTVFDFGNKGEDMSDFLNIKKFVELARDEELFVILRPGPYIGAQWDFGGIPSWLLRDQSMHVRSLYDGFLVNVLEYYENIYAELNDCFYSNGGSIIAMQIENDFGYFGYNDFPREIQYLEWLKKQMDKIGFNSLFYFTSESLMEIGEYASGSCPGVFQSMNIQKDVDLALKELPKDAPHMIMDFPIGTFDHWLNPVHGSSSPAALTDFKDDLKAIFKDKAAFNMYMFVGGTNFGFMSGGILEENTVGDTLSYKSITTSYDFDAPISESGDYNTLKTNILKEVIVQEYSLWNEIDTPAMPNERIKTAAENPLYPNSQLNFNDLCEQAKDRITLKNGTVNMEALNINADENGNYYGQSYGYILYETTAKLKTLGNTLLIKGHIRDMAQVFVDDNEKTSKIVNNGQSEEFGFWDGRDKELSFDHVLGTGESKIQILVENLGRVSFGPPHFFNQRKGLYEGGVFINDEEQLTWTAIPLEFKKDFINGLEWKELTQYQNMPAAYLFRYPVQGTPKDTFIDTSAWQKGVIFVNGFNLGRYWTAESPVKTMYLPAPLLNAGSINEIVVFEQYEPASKLKLVNAPLYTP